MDGGTTSASLGLQPTQSGDVSPVAHRDESSTAGTGCNPHPRDDALHLGQDRHESQAPETRLEHK